MIKKEINGYNGKYFIDEYGNIYNRKGIIKSYMINSGYLAIKLQNKGTRKHYLIHRLVAEHFLDKIENTVVDHIDGNRLNNHYTNLRYCTQKENLEFNGWEYNSGTSHYKAVFTIEQVKEIRDCREIKGLRNKEIYEQYPNISHTAIDQVLNYKTYKKIP